MRKSLQALDRNLFRSVSESLIYGAAKRPAVYGNGESAEGSDGPTNVVVLSTTVESAKRYVLSVLNVKAIPNSIVCYGLDSEGWPKASERIHGHVILAEDLLYVIKFDPRTVGRAIKRIEGWAEQGHTVNLTYLMIEEMRTYFLACLFMHRLRQYGGFENLTPSRSIWEDLNVYGHHHHPEHIGPLEDELSAMSDSLTTVQEAFKFFTRNGLWPNDTAGMGNSGRKHGNPEDDMRVDVLGIDAETAIKLLDTHNWSLIRDHKDPVLRILYHPDIEQLEPSTFRRLHYQLTRNIDSTIPFAVTRSVAVNLFNDQYFGAHNWINSIDASCKVSGSSDSDPEAQHSLANLIRIFKIDQSWVKW